MMNRLPGVRGSVLVGVCGNGIIRCGNYTIALPLVIKKKKLPSPTQKVFMTAQNFIEYFAE
jgi:hypothetical protein